MCASSLESFRVHLHLKELAFYVSSENINHHHHRRNWEFIIPGFHSWNSIPLSEIFSWKSWIKKVGQRNRLILNWFLQWNLPLSTVSKWCRRMFNLEIHFGFSLIIISSLLAIRKRSIISIEITIYWWPKTINYP